MIIYANLVRDYVYTRRPDKAAEASREAEAVLTAMSERGVYDPESRASFESAAAMLDSLLLRPRR